MNVKQENRGTNLIKFWSFWKLMDSNLKVVCRSTQPSWDYFLPDTKVPGWIQNSWMTRAGKFGKLGKQSNMTWYTLFYSTVNSYFIQISPAILMASLWNRETLSVSKICNVFVIEINRDMGDLNSLWRVRASTCRILK